MLTSSIPRFVSRRYSDEELVSLSYDAASVKKPKRLLNPKVCEAKATAAFGSMISNHIFRMTKV